MTKKCLTNCAPASLLANHPVATLASLSVSILTRVPVCNPASGQISILTSVPVCNPTSVQVSALVKLRAFIQVKLGTLIQMKVRALIQMMLAAFILISAAPGISSAQELTSSDKRILAEIEFLIQEEDGASVLALLDEISLPGDDNRVLLYRSKALLLTGETDRAETDLRKLNRATSEEGGPLHEFTNSHLGNLLLNRGSERFKAGQAAEASRFFEEATQFWPDSIQVWYNLAVAQLKLGNYRSSRNAIQRAERIQPDRPDVRQVHLSILVAKEKFEEAADLLNATVREEPDNPEWRLQQVRLLLADGKNERAAETAEELLEVFRGVPEAYNGLAEINRQMGFPEGELAVLRQKRRALPDEADVLLRLSDIHERLLQTDEALAKLDTLGTMEGYEEDAWLNKGRIHELQDSLSRAEQSYRQGLGKLPDSEKLRLRLAELLAETGNHRDAAELFQMLAESAPNREYRLKQALSEEKSGREQKALGIYEDLLETGDPLPRAGIEAAQIHLKHGRTAQGCEMLSEFIPAAYQELHQKRSQIALQTAAAGFQTDAMRQIDRRPEQLLDYRQAIFSSYRLAVSECGMDLGAEIYEKLSQQRGIGGELFFMRALALAEAEEAGAAIREAERAIRRQPELIEAHRLLALMHEDNQNWSEAGFAWQRYLSLVPDSREGYEALIRTYRNAGELESLIERWERRYATDPGNDQLRRYLIEAMHRAGMYQEAYEHYK